MKTKALSIAIVSLGISGCGEDAPDPPRLHGNAEESHRPRHDSRAATDARPEHIKVCAAQSVTKWAGKAISGATVIASGSQFLDGDVGGMTAPTRVNGLIAEGTPFVCVVYFGDKATSAAPQVRRFACDVPEELRFDREGRFAADKSGWSCAAIGG